MKQMLPFKRKPRPIKKPEVIIDQPNATMNQDLPSS